MSEQSRKSERIKNRETALQVADATTPKKQKTIDSTNIKDCFIFREDFEKELNEIEPEIIEKPTELSLYNNIDGKDMYRFDHHKNNTYKTKDTMIQKTETGQELEQISLKPLSISLTKIKSSTREEGTWNIKPSTKKITNKVKFEESNESFHDKEHEHNESENSDGDINNENKVINKNRPEQRPESPPRLRSGRRRIAEDYHFKTDEYFTMQSEKSVTSNHTLSRLKNPHLDEEKLQKLLSNNSHISKIHKERIQALTEMSQKKYIEWLHIMEEGFSVLLYGLGSKRLLINNFYKKMIPDEPTLIINGFFPSLTIKEILDNIIVELLGLETVSNQSECFDIIEKTMKKYPDDRIYLLIHNLDGGMLRSNKAQDVLSRLASIPNVHVLASVDHINAPLIWDNVKRARYNFFWTEETTYLPYEAETSYESSLLVQKSGALALLSLQNVFASLTSNAKAIYTLLVKYQLENSGNNYSGMAFKDLYQASREGFLVSSDQALRAQLTEFIDHKLVRTKRNHDGVEHLIIPLDNALLTQFLEQHDVPS